MSELSRQATRRALGLNRQLARAAANGVDWLFKRDTLIKSGRTWFELVYDSDLMAVRYYSLQGEDSIELDNGSRLPIRRRQHAVPLVLVPPLGVTTETFDLMPRRSLVRYLVASGFRVYLVDWGRPGRAHGHLGLADYSRTMLGRALTEVRRHAGAADLSLFGWCMGGLFCLLYQGQTLDPRVRNIVTVASPIDLDSGKGVIAGAAAIAHALDGPARLASRYSSLLLDTLDPALLSVPPWLTTLAFKLTDPLSSIASYWELMMRLHDRESLEAYSTTADYLNNMLLYPGGVLRDMAVKVVGGNQLASGQVAFGDSVARLDAIRCNYLGFAGEGDRVVPPAVASRIVDILASRDREFRVAPGGHMGVIIGSKACRAVWAQSVEWLAARSARRSAGTKASRRKPAVARNAAAHRKLKPGSKPPRARQSTSGRGRTAGSGHAAPRRPS